MAEVADFIGKRYFSFSLILVLFLLPLQASAKRKVTITELKCPLPKCESEHYNLIHVTAKAPNNSIHYLWSTIGSPTILIAYFENVPGPINVSISDWDNLISGNATDAIRFNHEVKHLMGFVIPKLIEFKDPKDKLFYTEKHVEEIVVHSLKDVKWNAPVIDDLCVTFTGSTLGGNITFQCTVSAEDGREHILPAELYTSNSSRFTITLSNLKELNTSKSQETRLGLELFSIAAYSNRGSTCLTAEKSIDDEFTPAVFKTVIVNNTDHGGIGSYIAWKPVAYTEAHRRLDVQVPSYEYLANHHFVSEQTSCKAITTLPYSPHFQSIAFAVQGRHMIAYGVNVSFGMTKDGWYQNHNYLSWSGMVGYGEPHFDTISHTVLIIIIIGLGAPLVVLVCGGFYIGVKKYRENKMASAYGRIN